MSGKAVLGAKSSELRGEPQPGAPVIVVRCNVLCGAITVKRPDCLMRRREERLAAKEKKQLARQCGVHIP